MENTKQQKFAEYIQSIAAIEDCMRPYRDQRKDLRKNFVDNHWLTKDEITLATKAFRMWEQQIDFDNLTSIYEAIETSFNEKGLKDDSTK